MRRLWDYSVAGVRAVAESAPDMQFAIEYKLKEPRVHMFFGSAARTLLAIEDMGVDNVGILLDLGHSLFAKETPAEVVHLVSRRGKLVCVEVNDNWREWDDDMAVGSVHLIETLEFLHALRANQLAGTDPARPVPLPRRPDPGRAQQHQALFGRSTALLDRIDLTALAAAQDKQDALEAQRLVLEMLLGAGSTEAAR